MANPRPRYFAIFVWVLSILASLAGGAFGVLGFLFAKSAPQEASAAAIGCLLVVAPYAIARGVQAIGDLLVDRAE